ncbi:pimeloyl-ACP methyl ester carboxylesterase [Exiguobacterium sp. PvP048]|uniref:alpha/beta fold hydrolase n=1 Tax=unclassified Exiguobacterium TaxID=2644629 RepID=UPI0033917016
MSFRSTISYSDPYLDTKSPGTPVIILTGMGCSYAEWYEIIQSLQQTNRVLSFHRHAWTEGDGVHRTSHAVRQLQTLLRKSKIQEPILLIGHSYGGLIAQEFTKRFPEQIKGLVLVDSTSVDLHELDALDTPVLDGFSSDAAWQEQCRHYATKTKEQLNQLLKPVLTDAQQRLPKAVQSALIDFQKEPALYAMMGSEVEYWKADAARIRIDPFPDLPLIVIARDAERAIQDGIDEGLPESELRQVEETWHRLVLRQATLTEEAIFVTATEAGHSIHLDRPDLVLSAVTKLDFT